MQTNPEEPIRFNSALLIKYKLPKYIKIVEDFSSSNIAKYLRRMMQDILKIELAL
jgi:hypothetical protein